MYWTGPWGKPIDRDASRKAVDRMNLALSAGRAREIKVLEYREGVGRPAPVLAPDAPVGVFEVQRRTLPFYEGWFLYRFACAADLPGYQQPAYAFCLDDDVGGPLPIDWTSGPILWLNSHLGLDLRRHREEAVREYLVFFCSFLGGEEERDRRVIPPFVLPPDLEALEWRADAGTLESVADKLGLRLSARLSDSDEPDPFDLGEDSAGHQEAPASVVAQGGDDLPQRTEVAKAFARLGSNPRVAAADAEGRTPDWPLRFDALVWYRDDLFESLFSVEENGLVRMDHDQPITGGRRIPALRWIVRRFPSGLRLLFRQATRTSTSNSDLLAQLDGTFLPQKRNPACFARTRIEGDVDFVGTVPGRIVFEEVEFTGRVVLDDCVFDRSLEFRDCRFLQSLSLKNATVKGSLILTRSRIEGGVPQDLEATERDGPAALNLRGLIVDHDLVADEAVVRGRVEGRSLRITGCLQARGLRGTRRPWVDGDLDQVDLSHATVKGSVDLSSLLAGPSQPGSLRTVLGGSLSLVGLEAEAVNLSGSRIEGDLRLSSTRCRGTIDLTAAWLAEPGSRFARDAKAWRTHVAGDLLADRSTTHSVYFKGCRIDGDVLLTDAVIATSLFAEPDGRFRCRIGGRLETSGAAVTGGLELGGALVAGELAMVTGHCRRITAGCEVWFQQLDESRYVAQFVPAEMSGILLDSVEITAGTSLGAIQLRRDHARHSRGGIVARGVRMGGSFRLWSEDARAILKTTVETAQGMLPGGTRVDPVDAVLDKLESQIAGDIDLRGVRVGGDVDVGCATVRGRIRLGRAEIGGDLRATGSRKTSCTGFDVTIAKVSGDVDLRRLEVRGDLNGRDLDTRGSLLLATEDEPVEPTPKGAADALPADGNPGLDAENGATTSVRPATTCTGTIDFQGVHASKLVLTASNLDRSKWSANERRIHLARASVGHLGIDGFERCRVRRWRWRFPVGLDLSRAQVGYWDVEPRTEVLPLLRSTTPFDRNIYIALEERCAKLNYRGLANAIWRSMVWRAGRPRWWSPVSWLRKLGNCANWALTGNGTQPLMLVPYLALSVFFVFSVLRHPRNVEPTDPVAGAVSGAKRENGNGLTTFGLAVGYAIPILNTQRFISLSARRTGPSCAPEGRLWKFLYAPAGQGSDVCDGGDVLEVLGWRPSPNDLAFGTSLVQAFLWLVLAANLPTLIIRRRG